jgi:hypothetical protein
MGLLKHVVLPLFALLHLIGSTFYFAKDRLADIVQDSWPGVKEDRTPIELHLLGAVGASHIVMLVGCLVGILVENSHFRGIFTMMLTLFYALDCYDAYSAGFPYAPLAILTVVGAVGSVIHAGEPGVFTKDKAKDKRG